AACSASGRICGTRTARSPSATTPRREARTSFGPISISWPAGAASIPARSTKRSTARSAEDERKPEDDDEAPHGTESREPRFVLPGVAAPPRRALCGAEPARRREARVAAREPHRRRSRLARGDRARPRRRRAAGLGGFLHPLFDRAEDRSAGFVEHLDL